MGAETAEATDQQLIEAAGRGDGAALEALLARYQPRIYRFSMKMCRRREDAQDVLQETLLATARTLKDFRGASSVSTWLYTIARSFCIKKRRKSKFAPATELSLEAEAQEAVRAIPDPGLAPDELLASRELEGALSRVIGSLDPRYRDVLVLRDVEGLPAAAVAEVMGLSVEAVKSRLHRARAALREQLAPFVGPTPQRREKSCPDVVALFSKHLEGDLGSDTCAVMEQHLKACGGCQATCESLKRTLGLCKATRAPAVPTDLQEQIRAGIRSLLARRA